MRRLFKTHRIIMACGLITLLLSGCASTQYLTVKAEYQTDIYENDKYPEVTASEKKAEKIHGSKRVLVYIPEGALSSSTNRKLADSKVLVQSMPHIWAAELEKLFMKKGFTILSLHKHNALLRHNQTTPQKVAEELGADFMVCVNSMEFSTADRLKQQTDIELVCYSSSSKNTLGKEVSLAPYFPSYKMKAIKNAFVSSAKSGMASAYLNASVVDINTGEVLFLYKNKIHSTAEPGTKENKLRFVRVGDPISGWRTSLLTKNTPESDAYTNTISVQTENQMLISEIEEKMIEQVCTDFIEQLTMQ